MQFFILVLFICLFVFLYSVYLLANDDFIFLRRDVTMERLFNIVFLGALVDLFFARFFFGIFNSHSIFVNPLVFLLFPYYPGLSLLGGVLGVGVIFGFLATRKKNPLPLGRLADLFSIAFLISVPIGYLGYFMFSENGFSVVRAGSLVITYLILFVVFLSFLLPQLLNGKFKEGTITFLFLISFSVVNLISNAFLKMNFLDYFKNPENLMLIVVFITSAVFLIKQKGLMSKIKKLRRPLIKINH